MRRAYSALALAGCVAFAGAVLGCAHPPSKQAAVGSTERPYAGLPSYLRRSRARLESQPEAPGAAKRGGPDSEVNRLDQLRALLAAVDAHVVSVGERESAKG